MLIREEILFKLLRRIDNHIYRQPPVNWPSANDLSPVSYLLCGRAILVFKPVGNTIDLVGRLDTNCGEINLNDPQLTLKLERHIAFFQ